MELNGGSVVAMVGKDCVAIACDLRLGNQALTVACNFEKVQSSFSLLSTILEKRKKMSRALIYLLALLDYRSFKLLIRC